MLPHSSWAALFIFFRGTVIKSRDKARTVLCRSQYLRYLSPFFTLRAALLFFTLISLHQNAKNRKKKKLEKRKRKRQRRHVCTERTRRPRSRAGERLGVGGRGGLGCWVKAGKVFGSSAVAGISLCQLLSDGSPSLAVPSEGPSLLLEPPRLLLVATAFPGVLQDGTGSWDWEQQGHPSQRVFADVPLSPSLSPSLWPCRHTGLSQTERLGVGTENHPCSLSITFGSGMDLAGPGAASHGKGDGSSSASPG